MSPALPPARTRGLFAAFAAAVLLAPSPARAQQVTRFDTGRSERAEAVATDSSGAAFVAGAIDNPALPVSFAVVKHNAPGALQWAVHYQGEPGQTGGRAWSIAVDAAGNAYAAGYIARPINFLSQDVDWLVVSFSPTGAQRWAHAHAGPPGHFDTASQVAVDATGAVFAAGQTGDANNQDWLVIKYTAAGAVLWQRTLAGSAASHDAPTSLRTTADGGLVVLGYTSNQSAGGPNDLTLARYDAAGTLLWRRDYTDSASSDEMPGGLALDGAGNTYVTAGTQPGLSAELPTTPFTLKVDAAGQITWVIKRESAGGNSIALAADGNLVASGTSIGDAGSFVRSAVSKFGPDGAPLWTLPQDSDGKVHLDAAGNIFIAGTRFTSGHDFYAAKLNAAGQEIWRQTYAAGGIAAGSVLTPAGDLLLAGTSDGAGPDMVTLRYAAGTTPVPPALAPAAPSALTLSAAKSKLTLQWTDNANNESGFFIERSVNGAAFAQVAQVGANVRSHADTGLSKNNTYAYRVRAFNAQGNSAYTNTATGKPK